MGYRIDFAMRAGTLNAVVLGRGSALYARRIAGDIAEEAARQAAKRVLIDLRRLHDRLGSLSVLSLPPKGSMKPERIAIVDVAALDGYYAFSEVTARRAGARLRRFADAAAAMHWLCEPSDDCRRSLS